MEADMWYLGMSPRILYIERVDASKFTDLDIDYGDGPNDFNDAYVKSGKVYGRQMTESELETLNTECHSLLYELIVANYY